MKLKQRGREAQPYVLAPGHRPCASLKVSQVCCKGKQRHPYSTSHWRVYSSGVGPSFPEISISKSSRVFVVQHWFTGSTLRLNTDSVRNGGHCTLRHPLTRNNCRDTMWLSCRNVCASVIACEVDASVIGCEVCVCVRMCQQLVMRHVCKCDWLWGAYVRNCQGGVAITGCEVIVPIIGFEGVLPIIGCENGMFVIGCEVALVCL